MVWGKWKNQEWGVKKSKTAHKNAIEEVKNMQKSRSTWLHSGRNGKKSSRNFHNFITSRTKS